MIFACMVCGTRTYNNYDDFCKKMDYLLSNKVKTHTIMIVSGGATGADSMAEKYAKEKDYSIKVFPADWNTYGKKAGVLRNKQMQQYIAGFKDRGIIAFWDGESVGTATNFDITKQYDTRIVIWNYVEEKWSLRG